MARVAEAPAGIADLHMHTHHSDGEDSPGEVLEWAERIGLDVIAITDHDAIDGAEIAAEVAAGRPDGPEVIVGEEVSSRDGHILGLFLSKLVPPGMSAEETVAAIHEQDGLAIAAHPYWRTSSLDHRGRMYGLGDRIAELDFDAVEVINGGFTPSMIGANRRAAWVAEALGRTPVGGSDAHVKHALGWAHTRFAGETAQDLRESIAKGRTQAGRSPIHPTGLRRYAAWTIGRLRLQAAG
jgi:predicted metal-dependent phosphoesterase TrpH